MSKQEFLTGLKKALYGLPQQDIDERLTFYNEMIEDRMEEGLSEEVAVSAIGDVEQIASQIIADTPFAKIARERIKPKRRMKVWEIVLIALGSPIWLSLVISAVAVIFSLYVSLWSIIISLWAVFGSLAACSFCSLLAGSVFAFTENAFTGIAVIATGIVCIGLSIFSFYGCKVATEGLLALTKKLALWVKSCFIKKGEA